MTTKTPRSTILEAFFNCEKSDVELPVEFKCDDELETCVMLAFSLFLT